MLVSLLGRSGFEVGGPEVVADEADRIREAVMTAIARGVDLVVATGGTGLGPRDVTPQAMASLLDYDVPGIGEAMRRAGATSTPMPARSGRRRCAGAGGEGARSRSVGTAGAGASGGGATRRHPGLSGGFRGSTLAGRRQPRSADAAGCDPRRRHSGRPGDATGALRSLRHHLHPWGLGWRGDDGGRRARGASRRGRGDRPTGLSLVWAALRPLKSPCDLGAERPR